MPSGRWKKLAIAGAILIIGIVTAWQFRGEQATDTPSDSKSPDIVQKAAERPATPKTAPQDAKLAGRIEPYAGWNDSTSAGAKPGSEQPSAAKVEPLRPTAETSTASYAAGVSPAHSSAHSIEKPQRALRPYDLSAEAPADPNRSAIDRFTGGQLATTTVPPVEKRHRIVDGDTLSALAGRYLGTTHRSGEIFEYNRDVLATPELLPIGKELRIPPAGFVSPTGSTVEPPSRGSATLAEVRTHSAPTATAGSTTAKFGAVSASPQTYVVQPHDTLALIARKLYGDIARQRDLIAANRQQLRTAGDLRPGMTLFVPAAR